MKSFEARLQAAEARAKPSKIPIVRCWFSDGSVKDMDYAAAWKYNQGELIDNEVIYKEPYITRAEIVANEDTAPKLCELIMQILNN